MVTRIEGETAACHPLLPPWMQRRKGETEKSLALKKWLKARGLQTVCQSAGCPNLTECFQQSFVTFLILGSTCTRRCRFCKVAKGDPLPVDPGETVRVAQAVQNLHLSHAVITSVTRDDLPDGGAIHYYRTVREIRIRSKRTVVEVLVPDFLGTASSVEKVLEAGVDVFGHNVETVPRLYKMIRPEADFLRSLNVLRMAKKAGPATRIKSGLMLGLGETPDELIETLKCLLDSGCDAVTLGQYLMPSRGSHPVHEFISPERFVQYRETALQMGFRWVVSGPYVRSSYRANECMDESPRDGQFGSDRPLENGWSEKPGNPWGWLKESRHEQSV